jgi:hypothetical protein
VIANTIEQELERESVLYDLALTLLPWQQWERAETVICSIERRNLRAEALCKLGIALAKAKQWERAEAVASTMAESTQKAKVLNALALFGEYEQLLSLVQRSWLQAETREYAIKLFPLVTRIISHKSDIGTSFWEAFNWVDTLLKAQEKTSRTV